MESNTFREPPFAGTEIELDLAVLERARSVLAWKCSGLDAAGMRTRLGPSVVTLGGLLKHLAVMEDQSFSWKVLGRAPVYPGSDVHREGDSDWEWRTAAEDTPDELFAVWQAAVDRSRAAVAEALTRGDLGQPVHVRGLDGEPANLRRIILDMIDEYARHNGQADLIRESVDGLVGEDPPVRLT